MRSSFFVSIVLAVVSVVAPAAAKLSVVTTTQDPAAITRSIGGDRVTVTALAKGYQDPHFLDAKPSYMLLLHNADLVEVIGLDLEIGYIGPIVAGARNDKIQPGQPGFLDLSQFIQPLEVVAVADRSQGDIHPNGNPHYWLDPENGRAMARGIAARLAALDPGGQALYAANLAAFEQTLTAKEAEWQARMAPLAGKPIITFHRSWTYFTARYHLEVAGFVEPKPGIPPAPMHTLGLIKLVRARGIKILLVESFYDRSAPAIIAEKSGARLVAVASSVGGDAGVDTYFDLFDRITAELERALRS
ncbi:MAG: zinc ABC transporter substrate-binding protein [Deltaproteobacteria bacterium]|nr:zinc ABC transporter substrate-binding protein [Deltaproteobacteria bacterium]